MPVVNLTLTNIFYLVSFISPLLIVFYLIFTSLLTGFPMKGVLYFTGCILLTMLVILIRNIIKNNQPDNASIICNTLPFPFGQTDGLVYTAPYLNISLLIFSFFYILFSMMYNKYSLNILLIVFLGFLCICNICVEFINNCVDITSIVISILVGALFALLWYTGVSNINPAYTYFSEFVNNNVVCSKPRPQSYVCSQRSGSSLEDRLTEAQVSEIVNSISNSPSSMNMFTITFVIEYTTTDIITQQDVETLASDINNRKLKHFLKTKLGLSDKNIVITQNRTLDATKKTATFDYNIVIAGSSREFSNDEKLKLSEDLSDDQKFNDYFKFSDYKPLGKTGEQITAKNVVIE